MDKELFELCKQVYEATEWDNTSATNPSERLKVWQRGYSISQMGKGHEDYESTPVEERNKVNIGDWEIRDDPRHKITTGQEVFKWWYSEVKTIENNVIPVYTSDYLLEKLPKEIYKDETIYRIELMSKFGDEFKANYVTPTGLLYFFLEPESDTPLKTLLELTLKLKQAGEI